MKVLWLCNIMLPRIAKGLSMPFRSTNGWLTGLSDELLKKEDIRFFVTFPVSTQVGFIEGSLDKIGYYGFPWNGRDFQYDCNLEEYFLSLLQKVNPDLVHIFGTEFPHTLAMVRACEKRKALEHVVISIQGLVSVYAEHYLAALPQKALYAYTFRDFIRQDNIIQAQKKYKERGILEIEALQKVSHVIGRTEWDRACVDKIHSNIEYHFCNETLRGIFYKNTWSIEACERHSVFVSQWGYPIKGFHFLLRAMPKLIKRYPDLKVYTTGDSPFKNDGFKHRLKRTYYQTYIMHLIERNHLKEHIVFLGGELDEVSMCKAFLRAHVFLSPSSIENSPNSLGEAMLLGVPCVSSDVGGVRNMLKHEQEGLLYPYDEYYMIAYDISRIFDNDDLACRLSMGAKEYASRTHDPEKNMQDLMQIYNKVSGGSE